MVYHKEECIKLAAERAAILLLDGYMENGAPIISVRRVGNCGGIRSGRDSRWCVTFKKPLNDGCEGCTPDGILGTCTKKELDVSRLNDFVHKSHSYLSVAERQMLISDAIARLKEDRS
jgi:hypothetical protein